MRTIRNLIPSLRADSLLRYVAFAVFAAFVGTFGLGLSGFITGIAIWKAHEGIRWWMAGTPSDSWLEISKVCVVGIPGAAIAALWVRLDKQKTNEEAKRLMRVAAAQDAREEAKDKAIKSLTLAIWRHSSRGGLTPYAQQEIEHWVRKELRGL
jgi:hypothetical protein